MKLQLALLDELEKAMEIINMAKKHLQDQGIDQWQSGYPDAQCITDDIMNQKGYFLVDNQDILGYLCIDFQGEPAYDTLNGNWSSSEDYVVVHRMAFHDNARGKNISGIVFPLVEILSKEKNVQYFRVDTDADNMKMRHILTKNGFHYCGTIWFDNSEKIAFDKHF